MCMLKISDFYYGSFLSALMNTAGKKPSLFDRTENDSRRIYRVTTDGNPQDCVVYAKYLSRPSNITQDGARRRWSFQFSDAEMTILKELRAKNPRVKLALICGDMQKDAPGNGELALLDYGQAMDCLGEEMQDHTVSVLRLARNRGLRVYGTGRDEKVNGKDNTIRIGRGELDRL